MSTQDGPSRRLLAWIAVFGTVAVLAILVVILRVAAHQDDSRPVAVAPVPAPMADSTACQSVSAAFPGQLAGGWKRVELVDPAPPATAAWRHRGMTVVARCGMGRPAEFVVGAAVEQINGVQWLRVRDPAVASSTWFVVDRLVYVAVTAPDGSGSEPLTELSDAIAKALPAVKPNPNPPPN